MHQGGPLASLSISNKYKMVLLIHVCLTHKLLWEVNEIKGVKAIYKHETMKMHVFIFVQQTKFSRLMFHKGGI